MGIRRYAPIFPVMALFILYTILWWIAVIGISRAMTLPIDEQWAGSSMLLLQGGIAVLWVAWVRGVRGAAVFAGIVLPLAFLAEYVGVRTGFPFGAYSYEGTLVPRLLDTVPAPISLAWLMIALGSLTVAHSFVPHAGFWRTVALSTLLATVLDAVMEPTAVHIKQYWTWHAGGAYYGIPASNFIGWLAVAFVINACAAWALWRGEQPRLPALPLVPLCLYWLTMTMFATIAWFRGYPIAALLGWALTFIGVVPLYRMVRPAAVSGWWRRPALSTPRSPVAASAPSLPESARTPAR